MSEYRFETQWTFLAPVEQVWAALTRPQDWPSWWPNLAKVESLEPGDSRGIGSLQRYHWKTQLPYRLNFAMRTTQIVEHKLLEGQAKGELEGLGRWTLEQDGVYCHVQYLWIVRTHKPWMNLLAPLLRPAFVWNHDQVMKQGGLGLAQYLGVALIEAPSREVTFQVTPR